jgi:hypothetical protein
MEVDDTKSFPIQAASNWGKGKNDRPLTQNPPCTIPWWLAEEAYEYYSEKFGIDQSLERLAERGGFGRKELLMLLKKDIHFK